jgi:hypothetical protein
MSAIRGDGMVRRIEYAHAVTRPTPSFRSRYVVSPLEKRARFGGARVVWMWGEDACVAHRPGEVRESLSPTLFGEG